MNCTLCTETLCLMHGVRFSRFSPSLVTFDAPFFASSSRFLRGFQVPLKMHQKYQSSNFFLCFDVFLPHFEGCCVFLSCRVQVFPKTRKPKKKNTKHINIFRRPSQDNYRSAEPHPSQGQTGQNGEFTAQFNRKRTVCPRKDRGLSQRWVSFSQGQFPFVPGDRHNPTQHVYVEKGTGGLHILFVHVPPFARKTALSTFACLCSHYLTARPSIETHQEAWKSATKLTGPEKKG